VSLVKGLVLKHSGGLLWGPGSVRFPRAGRGSQAWPASDPFTASFWAGDYFWFQLHDGVSAADPDHDQFSSRPRAALGIGLITVGRQAAPSSTSRC